MVASKLRVGFIGLGSQGGPMAQAVIDAGFPTTLWARRSLTLSPYLGAAEIAETPATLARSIDLVGICVLDDADVEEVVLGSNGLIEGLRPGAIVAVHSTVHPKTCLRIADALADIGAELLDAPVSGGGTAATVRQLLVMVGGRSEVLERARPAFESFGEPIVHVGPLGSGQLAKLMNNLLFMSTLSLVHQTVEVGKALDLDPSSLIAILQIGSSRSFALDAYVGMRRGFGGASLASVAGVLEKDLRVAQSVIADRGAEADMLDAAALSLLHVMAPDTDTDSTGHHSRKPS